MSTYMLGQAVRTQQGHITLKPDVDLKSAFKDSRLDSQQIKLSASSARSTLFKSRPSHTNESKLRTLVAALQFRRLAF